MAVLTCKQEQHSNCEEGCQTKVFLLQCNLSTDLLVFIKLKFLRILNFSQSFQEQVMTGSSSIQLHLNLFQYLFLYNLFHLVHDKFMTRYFGFLYWCSLYWKNGAYFNQEFIFQLIPTSIWYDLLTVSQIWSSNHQQSYFF